MEDHKPTVEPRVALGVELSYTDGSKNPPTAKTLTTSEIEDWFVSSKDQGEEATAKIVTLKVDSTAIYRHKSYRPPVPHSVVNHAIWTPDVYYNMAQNPSGGAAALVDDPVRFVMQTPLDGGPFCSLVMSKVGILVKGIYTFDRDEFDPCVMYKGEVSYSGWRSSGFQIINLPQAILRTHSMYISRNVSEIIDTINEVEHSLSTDKDPDIARLNEVLHSCNSRIIDLERRSRFEQTLITAIESIVSSRREGRMPWGAIAPQKAALEARGYDIETLPRRIDNARMHMSGIVMQRNARMNLQIADASRRMTQIALSDNASMKTIAILTMIFLPTTAVASFFSMNMFNWYSQDGAQIASPWLWVFFVVAVPLTVVVLGAWWWVGIRSANRHLHRQHWWNPLHNDLEAQRDEEDEIEMGTRSDGPAASGEEVEHVIKEK